MKLYFLMANSREGDSAPDYLGTFATIDEARERAQKVFEDEDIDSGPFGLYELHILRIDMGAPDVTIRLIDVGEPPVTKQLKWRRP